MLRTIVPPELRGDLETLWDYGRMHHEPRPVDVGIGLGSQDREVPVYAALGWAVEQLMGDGVREAFSRLVEAGFDRRLLPE
ncbi:hypothetical protein [Nocardia acidivorans]|uniref:hypothetical protein n=1 Tax=Nocardia acidivorans TaxID=404580 RepID=UPI000830BAF1|nr:hypothetical protein [Nocardia acidivorans]